MTSSSPKVIWPKGKCSNGAEKQVPRKVNSRKDPFDSEAIGWVFLLDNDDIGINALSGTDYGPSGKNHFRISCTVSTKDIQEAPDRSLTRHKITTGKIHNLLTNY